MSTKGRKFPPEVLSADEVRALMDACSRRAPTGKRNRALIAVMWRAGLRVSEALDLRPANLDAARGTLTVVNGKGGRSRVVALDAEAFAYVDRWLDARRALGISSRKPLFCTLQGGRLWDTYVRRLLPRLAAKAGIERRVNPHALRHTMAAELAEEGNALPLIQEQLGHASLDGTSHYLRKIAPADLVKMARDRPAWDGDGDPTPDPPTDTEQIEMLRREVADLRRLLVAP